jgi:hypothetical protein
MLPIEIQIPGHKNMTTKTIAKQLVALCRKAEWEKAQKKLFAKNAVSIEAEAMPGSEKETKGLKAIIAKSRQFSAGIEKLHSLKVSEPVVAEKAFACAMSIDMTMKGQGRMKMGELCVYQVKKGKIVSEEFFY